MAEIFDTLLLLALPASGKSEVRNYLTHKSPEEFHMGMPTIQLDDYPYVHMHLRIDEELEGMGQPRLFHESAPAPYSDPREWAALVYLLNEDYEEVLSGLADMPDEATLRLFERFDDAAKACGMSPKFANLADEVVAKLVDALEPEARKVFEDKAEMVPISREGKTIVIEFARGGPKDKGMPLPDGYGYMASLPQLSPALYERAAIFYIWVTPEESRRKNRARARPDGAGSILFHGTPEQVMHEEYACDDMEYLLSQAVVPDTVRVTSGGQTFDVPTVRFDNRVDKTSFLRDDPSAWKQEDIDAIHGPAKEACEKLWAAYQKVRAS